MRLRLGQSLLDDPSQAGLSSRESRLALPNFVLVMSLQSTLP